MITHHIAANPLRTACSRSPLESGQYSADWMNVTCADCLARRERSTTMADVVERNSFGELAEKLHWRICTGDLTECHTAWGPCCRAAQEVLADGWRKVGADAETRTEWGVHLENDPRDIALFINESDAQDCAADDRSWCSTQPRVIKSRTVTETAWTTPEEPR